MRSRIEEWLESRLGIIIDLTPENFGKHTKDGTLLAKLLYSYGAIPLQIFKTIKPSKNVNECYNNLIILKPWLEYVDVRVKDEVLHEVSDGKGTTALHLFYTFFLNMNSKDKFYYLSKHKERKYCQDHNVRDIKVIPVAEKELHLPKKENESKLAQPIIKKSYNIDVHREKCNKLLEEIRSVREKYAKSVKEMPTELGPIVSRHASSKKISLKELEIQNTQSDIKNFTDKHLLDDSPDLDYQELVDLQNQVRSVPVKITPNLKEAREYLNLLRQNAQKCTVTENFQIKMQQKLIHDLWGTMVKHQNDRFEELVCQNLLKQSQYEKQMCTKLSSVRYKKRHFVKRRREIENMNIKNMIRKIYDDDVNFITDMVAEDLYDHEFEKQRLQELHRRVYVEKVKFKFKERLEEARNILYKLIDIAIRISEFREAYACEIPRALMKDFKELFFKDLPVFDVLDDVSKLYEIPVCSKNSLEYKEEYEEFGGEFGEGDEYGEIGSDEFPGDGDKELCEENKEYDSARAMEFIRQEVLNECDLNDYLFLVGPWLVEVVLPDDKDQEVDQEVLGYIVHKMLACKYPTAREQVPAGIKPMNIRGVVQGSSDDSAFMMLSDLLSLRNILLVRVDDAINFVLQAYKNEGFDFQDLDATFQLATKNALKGKSGSERTQETLSSKKETLLKKVTIKQKKMSEEKVCTKEVGVQTPRNIPEDDRSLTSNAEIGRSVFESLGIGDPVPDVLVIAAVIAYVISLQDEYDGWVLWNYPVFYSQASKLEHALTGYQLISTEEEAETVEGVEGFGLRSSCNYPNCEDQFAEKRKSRLVPKLELNPAPAKTESYFTSFVRMVKKNEYPIKTNTVALERGQDRIEKFYSEQDIYQCFEYSAINFEIVKDVGKAILGEFKSESSNELNRKSSLEIFGKDLVELNEKYSPKKRMDKDTVKLSQNPIKQKIEQEMLPMQEFKAELEEDEIKPEKKETRKTSDNALRDSAPGDPNWKWATGEQSEEIQLALANFWEHLEVVFIEDFKFVFFCLRVHRTNILKYKAFLKKAVQSFMRREDEKQVILSDFQSKFNDIDDDLRPDSDVKCELHVRVSELEETLMEIADERRDRSEKYRKKVVSDNWVADELVILVNLYSKAMQLEGDRSIDTCQFINDYYCSLQQKLPQENVLQKIFIPSLSMNTRTDSVQSSPSRSISSNVQSQSRTALDKTSRLSFRRTKHDKRATLTSGTRQELTTLPRSAEAIFDILVNLTFPQNVGTPFHRFFLNNSEDFANSVQYLIENCITSLRKGSTGTATTAKDKKKTTEVKTEGNGRITEEWQSALEDELNRFLFRIKLIQARAIQDFNEFIMEVLNTLVTLSDEIGDIYDREAFNISECCKVFRCAIEEETPVQPRLELTVDKFIINTEILLYPNPSEDITVESNVAALKNDFTIEQLNIIRQKLQYIAPECEIVRRAFIYILEDLRVLKSEDGKPKLLPDLWDNLTPNDLPRLFDLTFGRIEIVNWRDFIVYALYLQPPTDTEILNMRSAFRSLDPSGTEQISFADFMSVRLWFEDHIVKFNGYDVKELLFKMHQIGCDSTNYTSLLLSFCKDEDPSIGFLKALSLSSGKRIVTDYAEDLVLGEEEYLMPEDVLTEGSDAQSFPRKKIFGSRKEKGSVRYPCSCKSEYETSSDHVTVEAGESYGLFVQSDESQGSLFTSDVPCSVVKKVLLASYPALPQVNLLLSIRENYQQTLDNILSSLSENGPTVKASKLLKNSLIFRLIHGTNKFKLLDIQSLVKAIIEDRQGNIRTNCSATWQ